MKVYRIIMTVLVLTSIGLPVQAESFPSLVDAKHTFTLGGFRQSMDGKFYANPDNFNKAVIDFGNLDADDTDNTIMYEYTYRPNEKWLLSLGVFQFEADGRVVIDKELEYDGVVFEVGADLETNLEVDTYMFEVMYRVYKTDRAEIMLGGGLHMFDFNTAIESKVFVGEQEHTDSESSDDIFAPLPNFRAHGFYAITQKWALSGSLGWLSANYEDYEGAFTYARASITYRVSEHFGAGVGYQYVDVDITEEREHGEAGFDIQFYGPTVYLSYSF